ncbi:MAG: Ig-like domain-containing protein, partial [Acidobacteriota bacterium]
MLGAAGGHADYAGNEVDALRLNTETPAWEQLHAPTPTNQVYNNTQFYADSRPACTHSYYSTQFIDSLNRMIIFASPGLGNPAQWPDPPTGWPWGTGDQGYSFSFNLSINEWDGPYPNNSPQYIPQFPGNGDFTAALCVKHQVTEDVYRDQNGAGLWKWSKATNSWSQYSGDIAANYTAAAIDPTRNRIFIVTGYHAGPGVWDLTTKDWVSVTYGGLGISVLTQTGGNFGYPGLIYDEANDCFLFFYRDNAALLAVIRISNLGGNTWNVDIPTMTGTVPDLPEEAGSRGKTGAILNGVQYVPELKGFVIATKYADNVYFVRTSMGSSTPDTTPPSVPTGLTASAISSSQITLSWSPSSDDVGVAGYKIYRNGSQVGTTANASYSDTGLSANTTYTYTVSAYDFANNNSNQSSQASATTPNVDTTPPTVSITTPASGATIFGTVTIQGTASDNVGVAGVQFKVDGSPLGAETIASPYSVSWDTTTSSNGAHTLTAVARDAAGNTATSTAVTVTVSNSTPPQTAADTIVITDTSGTTQTNRPVSISRPFRQGEISQFAQAVINSTPLLTQVDAKNRWPDGSLKFAIISFIVPSLSANRSVTVSFQNQSSGNNTGYLTQSQMLDSSFDFDGIIQMQGATTQTISARTMLQNMSFRYWLQGPIVTSVILEDRTPARAYDKDFGDASKALHPIFEAWFYPQNHQVDVGYTVENTWASNTAQNGMRDLTYSLTLLSGNANPTSRFTQTSFNHIGRSRWHKNYSINQAGTIRVDHNIKYLVSTGAIPHYDTTLTVAPTLLTSKYSEWQNADKTLDGDSVKVGLYARYMNEGGANDWIGLMNLWDTLYLLTMDDRMKEITYGNADLCGRIPWHFREADSGAGSGHYFDGVSVDTQGKIVSINARPTIVLSQLVTNDTAPADKINTGTISDDGWPFDSTHWPDLAYIPYLFSGRFYYLEEMQYQAGFAVGWYYNRPGNTGYFRGETRG